MTSTQPQAQAKTHRGDPLHLRRIITGGTWIPQIDGLRFVAIVSVLLFHIDGQMGHAAHQIVVQGRYSLLARYLGNGDRGVELFFVISGYVLARPFLRQFRLKGKPVALRAYFLRRVTRLEPPYIASLLLYAVGLLTIGMPLRTMLPHLAASMFYLHGILYRTMSTINFVTWSLEIEIQFYLIAPLLGRVYAISNAFLRRGCMLSAILIFGALDLHLSASPDSFWQWTVVKFLHYFVAGFLLADLVEGHHEHPHRSAAWDLVSLVGWPLIFLLPRLPSTLAWLPLLILPVYVAAFYGPLSNRFFRTPFVALMGGMCYSYYLMHMLIISVVFRATRHLVVFQDFLANYSLQVLTLGTSIAFFATIFYVLIERPCMDPQWPKRLRQLFIASRQQDVPVQE